MGHGARKNRLKLSILDQSPVTPGKTAKEALEATVELAKAADRLGYNRYWVAEHHDLTGLASPAPDILLGMIGAQTENIRIGSGAVLLPHYRSYQVAERYNLLATLYPGRVDLGIGRAPGGSAKAAIALAGNFLEQIKNMREKLDELLKFLQQDFPDEHTYAKIKASPVPDNPPVPWLLGTSEKSALLAAEKGMSYAFAHFMTDENGPAILQKYRETGKGATLVAVSVICAETTEEAEDLAFRSMLQRIRQEAGGTKTAALSDEEEEELNEMREKTIIGNPLEVREQLLELSKAYQTDELMIVTITPDYQTRRESYEWVAREFDLTDKL